MALALFPGTKRRRRKGLVSAAFNYLGFLEGGANDAFKSHG